MPKGKKTKKNLATTTSTQQTRTIGQNTNLVNDLDSLTLDGPSNFGHVANGFLEEEDVSSKLLALQQQLERLDSDSYLLQQRVTCDDSLVTGNANNAKKKQAEMSLSSLKKRLSEVRQQLYGPQDITSGNTSMTGGVLPAGCSNSSLATLAKSYFGGIIRGGGATTAGHGKINAGKRRNLSEGFPGEGETFNIDDDDDDNGEGNDDELDDGLEDELDDNLVDDYEFKMRESEFFKNGILYSDVSGTTTTTGPSVINNGVGDGNLLDATKLGLCLFGSPINNNTSSSNEGKLDINHHHHHHHHHVSANDEDEDDEDDDIDDDIEGDEDDKDENQNDFIINDRNQVILSNKAEAELCAALELMSSSTSLTMEGKLDLLKEKFAVIIKQGATRRSQLGKANRLANNERIQRQLLEMELDKANAIKQRLESLCRDLHNENRRIKAAEKNNNNTNSTSIPPIAHNNSEQLFTTIKHGNNNNNNNISTNQTLIVEQLPTIIPIAFPLPTLPDKSILAKESNSSLVDHIISLADLFLAREEHFTKLLRTKETELLQTHEKAEMLASQLSKQTSILDSNTRRVTALSRSEAELKTQVRQYVDKFRQVEETLGKSNDLFGTFRAEMEQMGAKLARLERENTQLNSKCATLSRNIIEMADERTKQNQLVETVKGQKQKLEQLCRTLQAERKSTKVTDSPKAVTNGE